MPRSSLESPRKLLTGMRQLGHDVLDLLLPARCQLCDAGASPEFDRILCIACGGDWPRLEAGCPCCGLPGSATDVPCNVCQADPPAFDRARTLTLYEGKAVEAIQALKYHGRRGLAPLLGRWLAEALPEMFGEVQYRHIIPIPLHWRRRWWRGYNQAELLAQPIAQRLGVPLELDLSRERSARRQAQLGQGERRINVAEAFTLSTAAIRRLEGADILIVDDVFTTGATTGACARSLKAAGVKRVDVLALARTL